MLQGLLPDLLFDLSGLGVILVWSSSVSFSFVSLFHNFKNVLRVFDLLLVLLASQVIRFFVVRSDIRILEGRMDDLQRSMQLSTTASVMGNPL